VKEQIVLPRIIEKEQLDLMHFPYFAVPLGYRKPYVVTIHDLILHHFSTGEATTLPKILYKSKLVGYKYIIKQAAKNAKKVITVSSATKNEILDHLSVPSDKIAVTYEGVDLPVGRIKSHNKYGAYFLHVGNVYPHKNTTMLVKAFLQAFPNNDVSLLFVGRKDFFMDRLQKSVKKEKAGDRIVFLHDVDDEELAVLYNHARAVVVPSLMEGFGLPAVEAMAAGCLVIASDIPSLREVTGGYALFCNSKGSEDLAKKMQAVYEAKAGEYENVIKKGKDFVQRYSWRKMTEETLTIYENCISKKLRE
jgi:glycosyltransferase involved in cell wall biosynthesis